jgi:hypothetical protein
VATSAAQSPAGEVVQSWVPPELARDLRQQAERERRSVSAVIRLAIEDALQPNGSLPERKAGR